VDRFYVTTPIYYVNGPPHLGHTYTTVVADALTRFARLEGMDAYFLTGTDEHGDKIARSAAAAGMGPQEWVDDISGRFRTLWPTMHIEHNDFIRTTEERHERVVRAILQRVYDAGDIYFGEYEGLYCVGCELFVDEDDLVDGKCPVHGVSPELVKEGDYFFRMSRHTDWLRAHLEEHPETIRPERYRNEALALLREPRDLNISRPKSRLSWGIPLPFDEKYVTYVWFDALINYVSALGWPDGEKFRRYWPVAQHITAKDILKPHGIYWPCMLRSAGIPMYRHLNVHGFWRGFDGRKMSKTLGNTVDPVEMRDRYGADPFRYVLLREMPYGVDANIGDSIIAERANTDLANDLGNLASRTFKLVQRSFGDRVPKPAAPAVEDDLLRDQWLAATPQVRDTWHELRMSQGIEAVMERVRATNRYVDAQKPWELAKKGDTTRLGTVLYHGLEALRIASVLLWPAMPERMGRLRAELGLDAEPTLAEAERWDVLQSGAALAPGAALFPRVDVAAARAREQARVAAAAAATAEAVEAAPVVQPAADEFVTIDEFRRIRLRVGTILAAESVPKAKKLLRLSIDLGEGSPRQLIAGVAEHYAPEALVGRQIVVVANLQPATIRGFESQGMLLAADNGDGLAILAPDAKVPPGAEVH